MLDRPLTEPEEQLGDQVAALFYQTTPVPLLASIEKTLTGQGTDVAELIIEATLSRLYAEQRVRREFLATAFGFQNLPREEQETQLLGMSANNGQTAVDPNAATQLGYYQTVSANLITYESESWQKQNDLLFGVLLKLPAETLDKLLSSLKGYTDLFYNDAQYKNLEKITLPQALIEALTSAHLELELSHYETVVQKSSFLTFLEQCCQLIKDLRAKGTINSDDIRHALALATVRFKSVLEKSS